MSKKPFFIAEISANHAGSFIRAKKLILLAKQSGADAVKLQTYTADTMTLKSNRKYFKIKGGLWHNQSMWNLYDKAKTPLKWHKKLFNYARKIGITIFSTPFDETAVDFLVKLKCPIFKVASFEMTDIPLIKKIAKTKKPIIISTGMATIKEISKAFNTAKKFGAKNITLLYCVSNYPSKVSDFNLNNIKILKKIFKCTIGFSDHSLDNRIAIAAISAGAEVIEKHIALERQKVGFDIKFSLKGKEIKKFREDINLAYELFKNKNFSREKNENKLRIYRRSIFAVSDVLKGEKFTTKNIKVIRPGHGLEPIYYEKLIGKLSPIKIKKGNPIKKNILKR
jgi:pseudaminic acid synthase